VPLFGELVRLEKVRAPPKITFGPQRSFFARTFA